MRKNNARWILSIAMLLVSLTITAQKKFCMTYEDFMDNKWEELDSIHIKTHSKSHQMWWGGSDFAFTTGNKSIDKLLKKEAFAIAIDDTLYVNCRDLRFEGTPFGNGYVKARRIGKRSLLIVNKIIGKKIAQSEFVSAYMFGAIGGAISASNHMKRQVCYIISHGSNEKGVIDLRLINDRLMEKMLKKDTDLCNKYYSEEKDNKRMLASHIIPILEEAGLFDQKHDSQE